MTKVETFLHQFELNEEDSVLLEELHSFQEQPHLSDPLNERDTYLYWEAEPLPSGRILESTLLTGSWVPCEEKLATSCLQSVS